MEKVNMDSLVVVSGYSGKNWDFILNLKLMEKYGFIKTDNLFKVMK
jgi:hypothetical protein